ncbi:MAG: indolepyruvate ferredoxin oxidoreductase subunit alpha [Candidatus Pacebacteria bacterium]|nr:indolepyruvate ferredoxin oxidoreductase subunit alpha [Candidatus Paceibacterota bacterium]
MEEILLQKPGKKIILLGNEAIVRGALESGVQFVSTYPGTPASEIGNTFFKIAKRSKVYFEFSTNEKTALEAGIGASFSGLKTLVAMKNFGLNVCLDALIPFLYTGNKGPTVIIVADDPSCHSSAQSEENSRAFAFLAHIPILEPSDPQECKDFTKLAFKISEKFKIPVMIRTTTRVAHQRAPVKLGRIGEKGAKPLKAEFVKEPRRFVTLPPRVLEMKKELLEKIEKVKQFSEKSKLNASLSVSDTDRQKIGVITSGVSYLYVREALKELNLNLPVLKLGFFYPLPEKKIQNFIKKFKKVLIVEELEPYLEKEIERLAKDVNPKLEVIGKKILSEVGELKPENVILSIAKITGKNYQLRTKNYQLKTKRSPQLCPGCPYWLVFGAVKKAVDPKKVIFGGDIGCYMLAGLPPHNIQDYLSCMGSSIGIAHGIKKMTGQKLITFIGDSTFFHAGIPALINTVFNKSNPLIIVMENQTTAMTGHQPHPGAPLVPNGIKIEEIVRACGVKNLKIIDPINQEEFTNAVKEFLEKSEVSVIIARRPCIQIKSR